MGKVTYRDVKPDDPIFRRGVQISTPIPPPEKPGNEDIEDSNDDNPVEKPQR